MNGKKTQKSEASRVLSMPVQVEHAAGIDIATNEIFVAVPADRHDQAVQRFGTTTSQLFKVLEWLKECRIESVAMESTGVYWVPLFQILVEGGLEVYLVNARHVKNVPGRKSDVQDCQWLQFLHSVGLLRASYRPAQEICAIRTVARHRENLIREGVAHIQQMQKALDQMNVLLHRVISDITGLSGLAIIEAMLKGERDPERLAGLAHQKIRASKQTIMEALRGDYRPEHLFVLGQSLQGYYWTHQRILECDAEMARLASQLQIQPNVAEKATPPSRKGKGRVVTSKNQPTGPWREILFRSFGVDLTAVPSISVATAQTILMEVGPDWSAFPTAGHFASWLGLAPQNEISGGKVLKRSTQRTQKRVKLALRMAAQSLHSSQSYLGACYRRFRAKFGGAAALTAMAHKLARILWHLVTNKVEYDESVFQQAEEKQKLRRSNLLKKRAKEMGFELTPIQPLLQGVP